MTRLIVALLVISSACQTRRELHIDPPQTNATPFANSGVGGDYDLDDEITLDASGSYDPDGTIVSYRWTVASRAPGSKSDIADRNAQVTSFVLDAPGDYVFELVVTDDEDASAASRIEFHAAAPELYSVNAGSDETVALDNTVMLAGTFDADLRADVTVQWTIASKPAGSNATLTSPTDLTTSFIADREGAYLVRFTASTPYQSMSDDVQVSAVVSRQYLEYVLVDAEYSTALDRFITVSDVPPRLHVHDPKANTETAVALPESPVAVSVAPDGLRAAIAHASKVSIVDLQTLAVSAPYAIPISIHDIVFGADDRVHCFHSSFNSEPIRTLDIATGTVADSQGPWVYGRTYARLHPSTAIAYGATTGISPADIERYDVASTPVQVGSDSPYHGTYAMGAPLWFTEDGGSIITGSGNIFYSSSNPMLDMTYQGTLGLGTYNWVAHSPAAGKVAALRTEYDAWYKPYQFLLRVYTDQQFTLLRSVMIPDTPYNNVFYRSAGRFAAFSADATKIYVIVRADDAPGVVHALYTFEP